MFHYVVCVGLNVFEVIYVNVCAYLRVPCFPEALCKSFNATTQARSARIKRLETHLDRIGKHLQGAKKGIWDNTYTEIWQHIHVEEY